MAIVFSGDPGTLKTGADTVFCSRDVFPDHEFRNHETGVHAGVRIREGTPPRREEPDAAKTFTEIGIGECRFDGDAHLERATASCRLHVEAMR